MIILFGQRFKSFKHICDSGLSIVPLSTVYYRINKGWQLADAISTPRNQKPRGLELRIMQLASYGIYTNRQLAHLTGTTPKFIENQLHKLKFHY